MSKGIFVVGTSTDVGKTYVTGLLIKKLKETGKNPAYYKGAMSGNRRDKQGKLLAGDAKEVKEISGISQSLEQMCPYVYEAALSPHLASQKEGNPVRLDVIKNGYGAIKDQYDYITVEGSGGIICPLDAGEKLLMLEDVIRELGLNCVLVAHAGLGTINQVVLSAEYLKAKNIGIKGIIFNKFQPGNVMHEDNLKMCVRLTGLKVLACVKEGDTDLDIQESTLLEMYE